jgi:AcrR family transcriptional regulator
VSQRRRELKAAGGEGAGNGFPMEDEKREPLTRRRIVDAALAVVDSDGLGALTMRRLGAELGFEAMALYRHVPNKAALLDYLVEAVWTEMELPSPGGDPWRTLEELAHAFRRLARAHPNVFPVLAARPVTLGGAMKPVELALWTLRQAGCADEVVAHAFRYLVGYVYGYVQREMADRAAAAAPDLHQWYDLRRVPADVFPAIVDAAPHFSQYDFDASFEWGVRAALEGLRTQLGQRRRRPAGQAKAKETRSPTRTRRSRPSTG